MTAPAPLAGKTIVVTRPAAQAAALSAAIEAAGGQVLAFPLLHISAAEDLSPLQHAASQLAEAALAVFISPNAVDYALPTLLAHNAWPEKTRPVAVGEGTVRALAAHGIQHVLVPSGQFDSEALLALPELAAATVDRQKVFIFRGNGGRELLADTLRQRGATVDCVTCYQRSGPPQPVERLLTAWQARQLDAITVSSSEGLRHLFDLLDSNGRQLLARTPLFVPHQRIAEQARQLGLEQIVLTPAADSGIMTGLNAYNWMT